MATMSINCSSSSSFRPSPKQFSFPSSRLCPSNSLLFTVPAHPSLSFSLNHRPSLRTVKTSLSAVNSPAKTSSGSEKKLLLEVKDLTAVIAESKQEILKGVNLVVYEGEVHAVMGKNGSGKSTFAKVLVGHPDYEVTGGSVVFKGNNLLEISTRSKVTRGAFYELPIPSRDPRCKQYRLSQHGL